VAEIPVMAAPRATQQIRETAVVTRCGVGVAVADACSELVDAAGLVTRLPGGRGAVREVIERMLKARGGWDAVVARYAGTRA
jgi:3-deoxy-D-manno-octulosonate 8-phosphate phosphatase (KDO 8-P phosphatase)